MHAHYRPLQLLQTGSVRAIGSGDRIQPVTRSYVRVIVVWALTLLALYAFQEYFS
jgi:hypothetical protein